jgi:hypothetical protein
VVFLLYRQDTYQDLDRARSSVSTGYVIRLYNRNEEGKREMSSRQCRYTRLQAFHVYAPFSVVHWNLNESLDLTSRFTLHYTTIPMLACCLLNQIYGNPLRLVIISDIPFFIISVHLSHSRIYAAEDMMDSCGQRSSAHTVHPHSTCLRIETTPWMPSEFATSTTTAGASY